MRRHLPPWAIALVIATCLVAATSAQEWPGVYPEDVFGPQASITESVWMPLAAFGGPFSIPSPTGWLGYAVELTPQRQGLTVRIKGLTTLTGVPVGAPPAWYADGVFIPWSPACGCYLEEDVTGSGLRVETWTYTGAGWRWAVGCMEYSGHPSPWWEWSDNCVWMLYETARGPAVQGGQHGER